MRIPTRACYWQTLDLGTGTSLSKGPEPLTPIPTQQDISLLNKAIALALLGLLLCLGSSNFALLAKNAVDFFALGHSSFKTLALFSYVLLVLVAARSSLPSPPRAVLKAFFLALGVSAVFSLGEFVWYSHLASLSLGEESRLMRDGFWSVTSITHMHTSKVLLSPLFGDLANITDAGYPFEPLFAKTLIIAHLFVFALLLMLTCLAALFAYRKYSFGKATALTLCFFALTKNGVDGGPFSPEVWAVLPVLTVLLWGRRSTVWAGLLLFFYLAVAQRPWLDIVWRIPMNVFALSFPVLLERSYRQGLARTSGCLTLALALYLSPLALRQLVPGFSWYPYALNSMVYGHFTLPLGFEAWILTLQPEKVRSSPNWEILDERKSGPYTMLGVRLLKSSNPLQICRQLRLPIARLPVTWYPEEMELEIEVHPLQGELTLETDSALLLEHHVQPGEPFCKVTLRLAPGVNETSALALLGPRLMVLRKSRFEPYSSKQSRPQRSDDL